MRNVINALCQFFGADHVDQITKWVYEQLLFIASADGIDFTLKDLDESDLIKVIETACTTLNLTLDMLTSGTWLVPKLSERQLRLEACIELRPELFKVVLGSAVSVIDESVSYIGDTIERFGSDQHIRLTPGHKENAEIDGIFLNLIVNSENETQPISIYMSAMELSEVQRTYIEDKYHGSNPFNSSYWQHIQLSSLYRRLFNNSIFSVIEPALSAEKSQQYALLSAFGHDQIQADKIRDSERVYSEFGAQIGYKVVRHNVVDLMAAKKISARPTSSRSEKAQVVAFDKPKTNGTAPQQESDVATSWGEY